MAGVGDVDADEEDVDGEEGRCPEIERWEDLGDVWLCAGGRASKRAHDVDGCFDGWKRCVDG